MTQLYIRPLNNKLLLFIIAIFLSPSSIYCDVFIDANDNLNYSLENESFLVDDLIIVGDMAYFKKKARINGF
jgi:hypothetical protein